MPKPTNITPPRVPLTDTRTGMVSREWYQFFLSLFNLTGAGNNSLSIPDINEKIENLPDASKIALTDKENTFTEYQRFVDGLRATGLNILIDPTWLDYRVGNSIDMRANNDVLLRAGEYAEIRSDGFMDIDANGGDVNIGSSETVRIYSDSVDIWPDTYFKVQGVPITANNGLRVYNGSIIDGYGSINGWLSQYGGSVTLAPSYMSISSTDYFNVNANRISYSTVEAFNIGGKKFYVGSKDVEIWPDDSFTVRGVPITASVAPSDPSHLTNKAYVDAAISAQSTVFEQPTPSAHWVITHSLNRYPSVTIVDSAGSVVLGDITYTSTTQIDLYFSGAFAGKAYLN